jgi:hypothetical protein
MAAFRQLGGMSKRAGHATDDVTGHELDQVHRALADGLDDERDRAGIGVAVRDRQWDAFGARTQVHDDELAGLANLGDSGRLDDESVHVGRKALVCQDAMQGRSPSCEFLSLMLGARVGGE